MPDAFADIVERKPGFKRLADLGAQRRPFGLQGFDLTFVRADDGRDVGSDQAVREPCDLIIDRGQFGVQLGLARLTIGEAGIPQITQDRAGHVQKLRRWRQRFDQCQEIAFQARAPDGFVAHVTAFVLTDIVGVAFGLALGPPRSEDAAAGRAIDVVPQAEILSNFLLARRHEAATVKARFGPFPGVHGD